MKLITDEELILLEDLLIQRETDYVKESNLVNLNLLRKIELDSLVLQEVDRGLALYMDHIPFLSLYTATKEYLSSLRSLGKDDQYEIFTNRLLSELKLALTTRL